MQMIINLPDEVMTELLQVTQTQNQAEAVQTAIQGWLQQQLKLKIDDNIAPLRQLEPQEVVGTTLPKKDRFDAIRRKDFVASR